MVEKAYPKLFLVHQTKAWVYFSLPYHFPYLGRFFPYHLQVDLLSLTVAFQAGSLTVYHPENALPSISLSLLFSFATIYLNSPY